MKFSFTNIILQILCLTNSKGKYLRNIIDIGNSFDAEEICPKGWMLHSGDCFKMISLAQPWNDAVAFCSGLNGTLFTYNKGKKADQDFNSLFDGHNFLINVSMELWTGNETLQGEFSENVTAKILPRNSSNDSDGNSRTAVCATMKIFVNEEGESTTQHLQQPCTHAYRFICLRQRGRQNLIDHFEIPLHRTSILNKLYSMPIKILTNNSAVITADVTKPPPEGICPNESSGNWLRYGNFCYKFSSFAPSRPRTWGEAKQYCQREGSTLASIHSEAENRWIHNKVKSFQDNFVWIGGKYNGTNFQWQDETPFDYARWADGEPNNLNDIEECISIRTHDESGEWNDDHCYQGAGHVCQKVFVTSLISTTVSSPTTTRKVQNVTAPFNATVHVYLETLSSKPTEKISPIPSISTSKAVTEEAVSASQADGCDTTDVSSKTDSAKEKMEKSKNFNSGLRGTAIMGIFVFVIMITSAILLLYFNYFRKRRNESTNARPTIYGFDNVIYNADTITVTGDQHIVNSAEERECILKDDEDTDDESHSPAKT